MKTILVFISLLLSSNLQKKNNINFVGTWKVTEVIVDNNSPMANNPTLLSMMRTLMLKTTYIFKADHHFTVEGIPNAPKVPEGIWNYDPAASKVEVKDAANPKGRVLSMIVTKDIKGQIFFKMTDAPVTLKVYKQ